MFNVMFISYKRNNIEHDYAVHNFLLYKSNKTIWMFYGKFSDEGDNPVNNPNIYNIEGDNRFFNPRELGFPRAK